jgi:probable rRNA maturation factor
MITVQITNRLEKLPVDVRRLKKLARAICKRFGVARAGISIGIVGDREISVLNKRFLNHEGTTDCLSFDLSDEREPEGRKVFDLIVNGELALRAAARRGHEAQAELALYITHGLLHDLGFDDATAAQARRMHRTEDEILQHLGYGLVYNQGRPAADRRTVGGSAARNVRHQASDVTVTARRSPKRAVQPMDARRGSSGEQRRQR